MLKSKRGRAAVLILFSLVIFSVPCVFAQDKFEYDSAGKRDPFIQLVTPDGRFQKLEADEAREANPQLKLEGIMYDPAGTSYAIVNGLVVKSSEEVDGYRVIKIDENSVIFNKGGQDKQILLKKEGT
jgi:hypothetical protein